MEGRDAKGKFVKGNKIGNNNHSSPGRPKKAREERYYQITQSACTFADWKLIVKKAVSQAIRGDSAARKFLADYLLGPPPKELRITGARGDALLIEYVNDWRNSTTESA